MKTVTIPLDEFDKLRNGFENSELKIELENKINEITEKYLILEKQFSDILNQDFVSYTVDYRIPMKFFERYYFRKDNTPLWIKKLFN